jgi:hypothetical protein
MNKTVKVIVIHVVFLLFWVGIVVLANADNEDQTKIKNCGPWVNCNHNPPNFDGTCCHICYFEDLGYRDWYCAQHTNDIGFTDEERANLKGRFLYNGVNNDIRELLIMELNVRTKEIK